MGYFKISFIEIGVSNGTESEWLRSEADSSDPLTRVKLSSGDVWDIARLDDFAHPQHWHTHNAVTMRSKSHGKHTVMHVANDDSVISIC
jgi:hypothetical protein